MKLSSMIFFLTLLFIYGCATSGTTVGSTVQEDSLWDKIVDDLTDVDCIAAISLGKRYGDSQDIKQIAKMQELSKHVKLDDSKQLKCYKMGLVYNIAGGGLSYKALKKAIETAISLATK